MKTLFALCTLILFGANAYASSSYQQETLMNVTIDGVEKPGHVGLLQIDHEKREIHLQVVQDICGTYTAAPGQITCMAMPIAVGKLSAPIVKESDSCGSRVYEGFLDETPRDGFRMSIRVTDHSTRYCDDLIRSAITVEASAFNPWTNKTAEYRLEK